MRPTLVYGTYDDEASPLLRLHLRIAALEHPERREEVHLHLLLRLVHRKLRPGYLRLDRRVRDEDVGKHSIRLQPAEIRFNGRRIRKVADLRVVAQDLRAVFLERVADGLAYSARGPGDKRDLAGQVEFLLDHISVPPVKNPSCGASPLDAENFTISRTSIPHTNRQNKVTFQAMLFKSALRYPLAKRRPSVK